MSAAGFTFVTFVVSLIKTVVIFKIAEYLYGQKAGLGVLVFGCLATGEIFTASWPSQPTNAQLFETFSLAFLALYLKKQTDAFLSLSFIFGLIALQMYPPMYFLFLAKLPFYFYWFRSVKHKVENSLVILGSFLLTLLPLLVFEFKTYFYNLRTVLLFAQSPSTDSGSVVTLNSFFTYVTHTITILFSQYNFLVFSHYGIALAYIFLIFLLFLFRNKELFKPLQLSYFRFLVITFLSTLVIIVLLLTFAQSSSQRAYILVTQPYVLLIAGALISKLKMRWYSALLVLLFLVNFYASYVQAQAPAGYQPNLPEIKHVTTLIQKDFTQQGLSLQDIQLFVISPEETWGWNSSIYWYELTRDLNQPVLSIDYFSKVVLKHPQSEQKLYLICYGEKLTQSDECLNIFNRQTGNRYQLETSLQLEKQNLYYLHPNPKNTVYFK